MAWLGRQSTSSRRHSVGGAGQPNSLRDAMRARGGVQNLPRATTDVEDNEDIPVKGSLDWLSLNPFAPKAMQGVVDRLKATGEGAMDRIKAGIGEDTVDRLKAGGAGALDRFKAQAGAVLAGEYSAEDALSFSPPKRQGNHDPASSSEANGHQSAPGRKSTSLREALQSRGGMRRSVGPSQAPAPEASDPDEEPPQNEDVAADEQPINEDQPSLEKALSAPLPAVREDDEEETPQHEQPPADAAPEVRQEEVESEGGDVAEEMESKQREGQAEEPDELTNDRERGEEEVSTSPAAEAETETADAAEAAREAEVPGADTAGAEVRGLETASHDASLNDESVRVVAPDSEAKTENDEPRARNARPARNPPDSAPRLPVPPPYVSKNLDEHAVVVPRQEPKAQPEEPAGPPLLAPAPPLRRPDKESQDVGKLKELREFWGSKKSKGFAGPELGSSRLSINEAQATLQRLIAAGGDFDEVRRLRKLIQELDR